MRFCGVAGIGRRVGIRLVGRAVSCQGTSTSCLFYKERGDEGKGTEGAPGRSVCSV
jgi:hypothetical protein